jgi:hypothetical protein
VSKKDLLNEATLQFFAHKKKARGFHIFFEMKTAQLVLVSFLAVVQAWVPTPLMGRTFSMRGRAAEKVVLFDQKKERMASYVAEKGVRSTDLASSCL